MRTVLAVGLLITLCASAGAAPVHCFQPREGHLRPVQRVTAPTPRFAVPGRTDEEPPIAAVQRQCRLWLRLIVANPILTIRPGAHDGVANLVAGVAMLTPAAAWLTCVRSPELWVIPSHPRQTPTRTTMRPETESLEGRGDQSRKGHAV